MRHGLHCFVLSVCDLQRAHELKNLMETKVLLSQPFSWPLHRHRPLKSVRTVELACFCHGLEVGVELAVIFICLLLSMSKHIHLELFVLPGIEGTGQTADQDSEHSFVLTPQDDRWGEGK